MTAPLSPERQARHLEAVTLRLFEEFETAEAYGLMVGRNNWECDDRTFGTLLTLIAYYIIRRHGTGQDPYVEALARVARAERDRILDAASLSPAGTA